MFPGFNNSKKRGTISRGDFDRDGVKNRKDCEPLNFKKQDGGGQFESNVPGWRLQDIDEGRVRDVVTGKEGKQLKSSGYSWKDVEWEEE